MKKNLPMELVEFVSVRFHTTNCPATLRLNEILKIAVNTYINVNCFDDWK